ncbi:MAG: NAD(P)H-hydrate dehydratase [Planctomycetota bacterium]
MPTRTEPFPDEPLAKLPERAREGHKADFGRILLLAGSSAYAGAAILCGKSAARSGAGLVTLAVPATAASALRGKAPHLILRSLPENHEGEVAFTALRQLRALMAESDVFVAGPGLGTSDIESLRELLTRCLLSFDGPALLDASALRAFSADGLGVIQHDRRSALVLTPHLGEAAHLLGIDTQSIRRNPREAAVSLSAITRCVVVLKSHRTLIAVGERIVRNETGNDGLATAGTGDVLSGCIGALLARPLSAFDAARLGVHIHGLAADQWARSRGRSGLVATDLSSRLAMVFAKLET